MAYKQLQNISKLGDDITKLTDDLANLPPGSFGISVNLERFIQDAVQVFLPVVLENNKAMGALRNVIRPIFRLRRPTRKAELEELTKRKTAFQNSINILRRVAVEQGLPEAEVDEQLQKFILATERPTDDQ